MITVSEPKGHEAQLKKLSARLIQQQAIERKEVATRLQEDFAQCLSAIKLRVETLLEVINSQGSAATIDSLEATIADLQQTIASIRQLAQKLHPLVLDTFGIVSAMEWLCRETTNSHLGLVVQHHIRIEDAQIPPSLKTAIFRTVKRMLAQAVRSGRSGKVRISLQECGHKGELEIEAAEAFGWPVGNPDGDPTEDLEVAALKSRIEQCGGFLRFTPSRSGEMHLAASWPLKK